MEKLMKQQRVATKPYWMESAPLPTLRQLERDESVDVVVVGGGITGLTAAYLLTKAGRSVAVLERDGPTEKDTGHTSAHLTMVTDSRLSELADSFGRDHAQAVWDAGLAAIGQIDAIVSEEGISCEFAWVPGYWHRALDAGSGKTDVQAFRQEASLAEELGFDAAFVEDVPWIGGPGVRFENQARIHPRRYLAGVAEAILEAGGRIYRRSAAEEFCNDPLSIKANGHTIACGEIVIAGWHQRDGRRNHSADETRAVFDVRGRRARQKRPGSRCALLGCIRTIPLPACGTTDGS
jgi:glycine/D-amino acid oxidase-like deaminating enzyme